jgi:hypothetical protein
VVIVIVLYYYATLKSRKYQQDIVACASARVVISITIPRPILGDHSYTMRYSLAVNCHGSLESCLNDCDVEYHQATTHNAGAAWLRRERADWSAARIEAIMEKFSLILDRQKGVDEDVSKPYGCGSLITTWHSTKTS